MGHMMRAGLAQLTLSLAAVAVLAGCGGGGFGGGLFGGGARTQEVQTSGNTRLGLNDDGHVVPIEERETLFDLFDAGDDPNVTVEVNRYLWNASLEILDFMPIEAADPFTGIIVYGFGTPPGGARSYRATVYIQDPALEARSLRVAVQSRGGAVARETARQIEDAILTRARQLRIRDGNL